jgi:hypothetical protein
LILVAVAVSLLVDGSLAMVKSSFLSLLRQRVERPLPARKQIVRCIIGVRLPGSSVPRLDVVSEPSTNRRNTSLTLSGLDQPKRVPDMRIENAQSIQEALEQRTG